VPSVLNVVLRQSVRVNKYYLLVGDYPDHDRFNRVTSSRWNKLLLSPVDFYDVDTGAAYIPAINAVGTTTDDGRDYRFVYDAFGRLRKVLNQS